MEQNQNRSGGQSKTTLAGGIIIVLVLVLLGWYFFKGRESAALPSAETSGTPQAQSANTEPDAATAALASQSTSDEVTAIDQDLNATDLSSLNDINQL